MANKVPGKIREFKLYTKQPNAISCGYLYTTKVNLSFTLSEQDRTLRVYLPEGYFDCDKRYPVIYMFDGQNIVDAYTTRFGEWDIDDHIHNLTSSGDIDGLIVVGIDCPVKENNGHLRMSELSCSTKFTNPDEIIGNQKIPALGKEMGEFMIHTVKPRIDEVFRTLPDKKHTGIGGSSMGGYESFYVGCKYHNEVGFSLCFSPAFFLFKEKDLRKALNKWRPDPKDYGKFCFFVGGKDFEHEFVKPTFQVYDYMASRGFSTDQILTLHESDLLHQEASWSKYFEEAIKFLLPKEEDSKGDK